MIPKIIHYVWVGNNPKPKDIKKCMKTWKKHLKDYKIIEELKSWEVLCKLNNDSIIYASLPRHTEANMLSKNINDELYIKNFYLLG